MTLLTSIDASDVKVNDVITVKAKGSDYGYMFTNQTVTSIESDAIMSTSDSGNEGFTTEGYWSFWLQERPKPKLPTKLGAVVKVGAKLWVYCDSYDTLCWREAETGAWETTANLAEKDWELVVD